MYLSLHEYPAQKKLFTMFSLQTISKALKGNFFKDNALQVYGFQVGKAKAIQ